MCVDFTDKWLVICQNFDHANQMTNGAIEAWHLTMKKMIQRMIGGLKARRLDRLLDMLFGSMLPFFLYNIRRKAMGLVVNWRKEEVAISSVWAAENEMKYAKVKMCMILHFYDLFLLLSYKSL